VANLFLKCLVKAVAKNGIELLCSFIPGGEKLFAICVDTWQGYRQERAIAALRDDLGVLVRLTAEERQSEAADAVREAGLSEPPAAGQLLTEYAAVVPEMIRHTARRPADPGGTSIPENLPLSRPEDLLPFLPPRVPRFRVGARPIPGSGLELVEMLDLTGEAEIWKARNPKRVDGPVDLLFFNTPHGTPGPLPVPANYARLLGESNHGVAHLRAVHLCEGCVCLEYVHKEGSPLVGWVRDSLPRGGMQPHQVAVLIAVAAEAVAPAHRARPVVVHRHLNLSTIIVSRGPERRLTLLITRFGLAFLKAAPAGASGAGRHVNTEELAEALRGAHATLYQSPQQLRGEPEDPRDDVHALGVIWFQMLVGDTTRPKPSGKAWRRQLSDRGMSENLVQLLESCLDDDAGERPRDAGHLAEQLRKLLPAAVAPPLPKATPALPSRFENSVGMSFALLPAGRFLMGAAPGEIGSFATEYPQHEVNFTRPLYFGISPVTLGQFRTFVRSTKYRTRLELAGGEGYRWEGSNLARDPDCNWQRPGFFQNEAHPVVCVSWDDAVEFCAWLSKREGRGYRLPTEAEWEFACRAGSTTPFSCGGILSHAHATFDWGFCYGTGPAAASPTGTSAIGTFPPNPFGLLDMHGNVLEWCADWYSKDYYQQSPPVDPAGPALGPDGNRVLRGGSWFSRGHVCRSASRFFNWASNSIWNCFGFRVVVTPSPTHDSAFGQSS
jgi:formylglycine-generating enzyme required for sulfatase activity